MTVKPEPSRLPRATACPALSRNSVRFGRPVRPSWSAWCSAFSICCWRRSWLLLKAVSFRFRSLMSIM